MSADILSRVWRAAPAGLTPFHRLLLVRLAWYADDAGENCYPAVPTLMRETDATDRGVRKAMGELRAKGLISVEAGRGPKGTNRVALNMARIEGKPLNDGSGLNGGSGLNDGSGLTLNGGSAPLNGGSSNPCTVVQPIDRKDIKVNRRKTDVGAGAKVLTANVTEELIGTGLTPDDFAAYLLVRKQKRKPFVNEMAKLRWIARWRDFYSEGKDTAHMLSLMIENGWQGPVEEKWRSRPKQYVTLTPEEQEREWDDVRGIAREVVQ